MVGFIVFILVCVAAGILGAKYSAKARAAETAAVAKAETDAKTVETDVKNI